jgi:putative acetyltransferase
MTQGFFTSIPGYYWRHASSTDGAAIRQIIFPALEEHGLKPEPEITDKDLYDIDLYYKSHFFGVITDADNVVKGTFALYNMGNGVAEIRKMYLPADLRGKGLGKWMLQFLVEKAQSEGCQELILETASCLSKAIALYRSFGFETVCGHNASPRCDVCMSLKLPTMPDTQN